jgi:enoyl-CoA hydratase/carnithine racemase
MQAFCAGGDVKDVVLKGMQGHYEHGMQFFHTEYIADHRIATFPRPHIAVLDGITMGGGAGVSMHGHFRVATER